MVGDDKQLPAVILSQKSSSVGFSISLFDRLKSFENSCINMKLLDIQYRMRPEISTFPNQMFYNGKIKDSNEVSNLMYSRPWIQSSKYFGPYTFVNIPDAAEESDPVTRSKLNEMEIEIICGLIKEFRKVFPFVSASIGIISGYSSQIQRLHDAICRQLHVKTVDLLGPIQWKDLVMDVRTIDGMKLANSRVSGSRAGYRHLFADQSEFQQQDWIHGRRAQAECRLNSSKVIL